MRQVRPLGSPAWPAWQKWSLYLTTQSISSINQACCKERMLSLPSDYDVVEASSARNLNTKALSANHSQCDVASLPWKPLAWSGRPKRYWEHPGTWDSVLLRQCARCRSPVVFSGPNRTSPSVWHGVCPQKNDCLTTRSFWINSELLH